MKKLVKENKNAKAKEIADNIPNFGYPEVRGRKTVYLQNNPKMMRKRLKSKKIGDILQNILNNIK